VIKKFKKAAAERDIVQRTKNRRYFVKPSQERAQKKTEMRRLKKRARALKKQKNISQAALVRIHERLSTQ
jgi:ribosomal protein S21